VPTSTSLSRVAGSLDQQEPELVQHHDRASDPLRARAHFHEVDSSDEPGALTVVEIDFVHSRAERAIEHGGPIPSREIEDMDLHVFCPGQGQSPRRRSAHGVGTREVEASDARGFIVGVGVVVSDIARRARLGEARRSQPEETSVAVSHTASGRRQDPVAFSSMEATGRAPISVPHGEFAGA